MTDDTSLKISLLQHEPIPADRAAALQRLDKHAAKAAADGSQLLVVPEASVTGYNIPEQTMHQVALDANGSFTREIASLCRQHRIAIAYGFAEHEDGEYYNAVQLVDRNGLTKAKYRKTHLWGDLDRTLFKSGNSLTMSKSGALTDIGGFKLGFLICYDIEFPECARLLALQGADLLLVPTGLMQPWREVAEQVVPVRAYENQLFIAYANYCGSEGDLNYEGRSCIVGPDGKDLARAEQQPVMLSATLSKQAIADQRAKLPYHLDRRPELYDLPC